ncbi:MAG: 50S ribosomal protein L24 [Pseudomonadota bacterium]|nr:50S ribosomal protein L24 [Pseudomonadota bacterium]
MKTKLKIRRDDTVVVVAGKNKGKVGKVVRVIPEDNRLVVEGVAMVKRHVKAQGQQAGSLIEKEAAIHVSNVALWNAAEGRRVKVGFKVQEDGTKVRVDRKTGATV